MFNTIDDIINKHTVRLRDSSNDSHVGTGIIYYSDSLKDKTYIITAAHCLFHDSDKFKNIRSEILIDIFPEGSADYKCITVKVEESLFFREKTKDIAVLRIDKSEIERILGEIYPIKVVSERGNIDNFIIKGYPNATLGEEIAVLYPTWLQINGDNQFQLQIEEDYTTFNLKGFSGSGVFLINEGDIFLYGVFTRYRAEEKGKVVYCQRIELINEMLHKSYLPSIKMEYFGNYGMTSKFFQNKLEEAIVGLGPRFNDELNFQLPIAKVFNDIVKDNIFSKRLYKIVDDWIISLNKKPFNEKYLENIEKEVNDLKETALEWLKNLEINTDAKIDVQSLKDQVIKLKNVLDSKFEELYQLRAEEVKVVPQNKNDYNYRYPYEKEISRIREINNINEELLDNLENKINLNLANNPYLIIKGEAGNGKSHLLGDIAKKRLNNNLPTLLLLGQNFISSKSIWENIKSELDLNCTKTQFYQELNSIGRQIGSRTLIMIDAINEGGGAELWRSRIATFINEFINYPFIAVVLSVRTTYLNYVIPNEVTSNSQITLINHEGFKGNEYEALKLFCEFHGLQQPHFPILAPEFSNPLFLKIICEAVKETQEKIFPQGFQGISSIFQLYIQSLNQKFEQKREEYKNRKIVEKAINLLAKECFDKHERELILEEAFVLFDKEFSGFRNLINDLIEENIFIRKIQYNYGTKKDEEVIYFSYERFGDFFIAEDILNKFKTKDKIKKEFQKKGSLGHLLEDGFGSFDGLFEAFSVLLPEKFSLEIYEVFDWVYAETEKEDDFDFLMYRGTNVNRFFLESLKWRKTDSIDNEKITSWMHSENFNINHDEVFLKLFEIAPIKKHPFNSDRFFKILQRFSMPERDAFWQSHILWYHNIDDYNIAYPIKRLIDWAWTPRISKNIDFETARLTAQALTWLLASTHNQVRDQTTKALVNFLDQQPDVLIDLLKKFKKIDDLYIIERLYAVAYGCILRVENSASVSKIAKFVYNQIFKKGNPPNHILLRDYARNCIEYAVYKNPKLKFDLSLVRPPYNSKMPKSLPTKNDIEALRLDEDSTEIKKSFGRMSNRILFSVMQWDFGRYVVDNALDDFHSVPFTFENELKEFLNSLNKKQKKILKDIRELTKLEVQYNEDRSDLLRFWGKGKFDSFIKLIEKLSESIISEMTNSFDDAQIDYIKNKVLVYYQGKFLKENKYHNNLKSEPIKYWIVKRVFDLGYDYKLHGEYDNSVGNYSSRKESKIERIGKKYQWLAFYEILAMISDNYKFYNSSDKAGFYEGPWQMYLRDIDPAFVKQTLDVDLDEIDSIGFNEVSEQWYNEPLYNNWDEIDSNWIENLDDLPPVNEVIEKQDSNSDTWITLKNYVKWEQPKPIGEDRYFGKQKEIFYMIQAYLIKKKDKKKITHWLSQQNFWGRWMPESPSVINLINRENFWSPAHLELNKTKKWNLIQDTSYKIIIATTNAVGEMSDDKSGAHSYYDMPCETIFEGLNLEYAPLDGDFHNQQKETIVRNINYKNVIIKKRDLEKFLELNELDIIWTLLGEKMSYDHKNHAISYFKELSGVYHLENSKLTGNIISFSRE